MNKERIIITGSKGLVGSALADQLREIHNIDELSLRFGHDFTNEEFVIDYFSKNEAEYLVNCFGYNDHIDGSKNRETLFDITLDSINEYINVNVLALFSVCREFAKNKNAKGIVNISSIYGQVSPKKYLYQNTEKHIGYSISKAAVNQLTRHLAVHLAPKTRVNCIAIGGIEHNQNASFINDYSKQVPMGRMMKKDELVGLVNYLCSEQSSYTTGSIINIDGGWTSW